jgi:hypothetical protein
MENPSQYEVIAGKGLQALKGDCQDIIDFARKNFEVELSFDDKSIQWLSSFIEDQRKEMDPETCHNYGLKIGIFLGFAIIHHHGGEWVTTEGNNIAVRFPSGAMAFPFNKACSQFENGIVDNIYGLYRNLGMLLDPNGLASRKVHKIGPPDSSGPNAGTAPKRAWWQFWR